MPKSKPPYPEQFRREAVELVRGGRTIPDVAESSGVSGQSLRNWVRQEHESEYRLLLRGAVADFEYLDISSSLTGVFCGPRFPDARLADLRARCPELWEAGRVFRIAWRNGFPIPMRLQGDIAEPAGWQLPEAPVDPEMARPLSRDWGHLLFFANAPGRRHRVAAEAGRRAG